MRIEGFQLVGSALRGSAAVVALGGVFLFTVLPALGQDGLEVTNDGSVASITAGGRPVLRYQYLPQPTKPYVKEWFSPGGVNVLRDAPADHLHHHGLMFAVAVDGVDFWSENETCGRQKHRALSHVRTFTKEEDSSVGLAQRIDWLAPDRKRVMLGESRRIEAYRIRDDGATLLVWRSRLTPPGGAKSVTLSGSPYFGLGMRFVQSMDTGGRFQNADGKTGVDGTNDARSDWCAYWAVAGEKPVTVAMFDFPKNPRHPATWFTMDSPFAYLSATLRLDKEPLVVQADQPLELQYAAALWDGHVEPREVDTLYRRLIRQ
jgi:hypothetical protein